MADDPMKNAINATSILRPASTVYARPFGEELVLLEFARGEYFALDQIGALVWRGLERGASPLDIADEVAVSYDVVATIALTDILALLRQMQERALIEADA